MKINGKAYRTIWLTAVCINLVVWLMVSISGGEPAYFWPMWVAGPAGPACSACPSA